MSTIEVNDLQRYRRLCECLAVVQRQDDGSPAAKEAMRIWTALCQQTRYQLQQRGVAESDLARVEREVMQNG